MRNGIVAVSILATVGPASAQSFELLGVFPGYGSSLANAVSADGSTVVGQCGINAFPEYSPRAFRWEAGAGIQVVQPQPTSFSKASGVSADGSVIVGEVLVDALGNSSMYAARWSAGGLENLGALGSYAFSRATGVSADGQRVVGVFGDSALTMTSSFSWTPAGGIVQLPASPAGTMARVLGISADGSTAFGATGNPMNKAARWNGSVPEVLGPTASVYYAEATGASAGGNVIVGLVMPTAGGETQYGFRWTTATGMQPLPLLPGSTYNRATGVSSDGLIVFGVSKLSPGGLIATVWTPTLGPRSLAQLLSESGVNLQGAFPEDVRGVSADGRTIVGAALVSPFAYRAYRATLPAWAVCGVNCDGSSQSPFLNIADFACFLQKFASGDSYANCDQSTSPPILNIADFSCFLQKFAAGCP